jgi:hypothetical protein
MNLESLAKLIIIFAFFLLFVGITLFVLSKVGKEIGLGKLPGDIHIKKKNFEFYFPLTTFLLLSLLLTILLNLIFIFLRSK